MRSFKSFSLLTVLLFWGSIPILAQDIQERANEFMGAYENAMNQKSVQQVLDLIHPDYGELPHEMLKDVLQQRFDAAPDKTIKMQLHDITSCDEIYKAWVTTTTQYKEGAYDVNELYLLQDHGGQLKLAGIFQEQDPNAYDPDTHQFTSTKGQYGLTVPKGWLPLKGAGVLAGIAPDSLILLAPDLKSQVIFGLVQVPMKLADTDAETARLALFADVGVTQRLTQQHQIHEEGSIQVAGLDGYQTITSFSLQGQEPITRMRTYLSENPMLYFFVCDVPGEGSFETYRQTFAAILSSFSLKEPAEGMTRQESLAAEHASGAVTGRVYTSDEYNCFIAAPEGWEIRTSSNPAHLVEMQYTKGRSICRLIAGKGIPETMTAKTICDSRIDGLKALVKDFQEITQEDVTIQGITAVQSIQTFAIEEMGQFHVKEVTLVKDGACYLILCQCIEPDDYSLLEKDFDQVINSFGFIK